MKRYKLREERKGALLFDSEEYRLTELDEDEYKDILAGKSRRFSCLNDGVLQDLELFRGDGPREELPDDCLSYPSKVYLEITRRCNLSCRYCYNKSGGSAFSEMPFFKVREIIDEMAARGAFELRITGGEPTMHPELFNMIDYAVSSGLFVSLATNGVMPKKTAERISCSGVSVVIVSLDGDEEFNDRRRGRGSFSSALDTLRCLRKNKSLILKINCVLDKTNIEKIGYMVHLAESLGGDYVNFGTVKLSGRAKGDEDFLLDSKDMHTIVRRITNLRKKTGVRLQTYMDILDPDKPAHQGSLLNLKSCAAGIEVAAVLPNGDVTGCVVSTANAGSDEQNKVFVAGNIFKTRLKDIWLDSSRWKIFRRLEEVKSRKCRKCRFYTKKCFGNCVVESYLHSGQPDSNDKKCFEAMIR